MWQYGQPPLATAEIVVIAVPQRGKCMFRLVCPIATTLMCHKYGEVCLTTLVVTSFTTPYPSRG